MALTTASNFARDYMKRAHSSGRILTRLYPPARGGYTLTELLILVLVLGIVIMATIPLITAVLEDIRLSRATADVVAALEYARARAAVSGMDVRVSFPDKVGTVRVERYTTATNLMDGALLVPDTLVERGIFVPVPHPLTKQTNAFVALGSDRAELFAVADFEGTNTLEFQAYGVPSRSGRVDIVYGERRHTVVVEGETGRVVMER